jgi:1-acyl-sn-glycerol-3-phosphate acyltransferase
MITARHSAWAEAVFTAYLRRLFRRHFHALRLLGEPPSPPTNLSLVLVPNHGTWWDGFFLHFLNRMLLKRRLHLMMLEEQLHRFQFFRLVGAFGIRPGSLSAVSAALGYSASVLADPANALCVFPQGRMRHPGLRPLDFRRGLERILHEHGGPVAILPLAIRCDFGIDQRPEAYFRFDVCHEVSPQNFGGVGWLEERTAALLDQTDQAIASGEPGRVLLAGRAPVNERWTAFRRRLGLLH